MQIAVLSGKGGTGKTLLSVNLSYIAKNSVYVDCDVEEPNGLLYYQLRQWDEEIVYTKYPLIEHDKCIGCRKCTDFCQFNALAYILDKVRVFKELCHSCGGCKIVCPVEAITEVDKDLGKIKHGTYEETEVYSGELRVGEESGVPIIKELLKRVRNTEKTVFIDSPPGNGCSVMESISDADYCLLVAEPSIFGLHNLNMVYELTRKFNKKIGLIINKSTENNLIREYAEKNNIKVLAEIPMNLELGKLNSNGEIIAKHAKYKNIFNTVLSQIFSEVST